MEYQLVAPQMVTFGECSISDRQQAYRRGVATVEIHRKMPPYSDGSYRVPSQAQVFPLTHVRKVGYGKRQRLAEHLGWTLNLTVFQQALPGRNGMVRVYSRLTDDKESCFARLENMFGSDFSVDLSLHLDVDDETVSIIATNMKVKPLKLENRIGFEYYFMFGGAAFSEKWRDVDTLTMEATFRMTIRVQDGGMEKLFMDNVEDPLRVSRKLLKESVSSDAVIIAGNGAKIPCHKGFLSAHSPVFRAMFESNMKEGTSSTVKIPDMTEEGVRALLAYLYCWEMGEASKSCAITLELLQASDKYNIPRLQQSACDVILEKESDWFDVGVALELLQFARVKAVQEGGKNYKLVEEKIALVLKSKSRSDFQQCAEFQDLFEDRMGMELCAYLITKK